MRKIRVRQSYLCKDITQQQRPDYSVIVFRHCFVYWFLKRLDTGLAHLSQKGEHLRNFL